MISLVTTANGKQYFTFKSEYNAELVKRVKVLPGAKFIESRKTWVAPVDPAYFGNIKQIEKFVLDATDEVKALIGVS